MSTKITVVGQAPYPVAVDSGRHIAPGEIAKGIDRSSEVESLLTLGLLREVAEIIATPSPKEVPLKPRADKARDENQED